ncbi:MAG: tRNA A-37 threonylcarbamoyl transferase component Bud32 [Bradymonadia bacterium]|jgi:tRNA A-37 threonylcarbamoyl transferase component Bud32
MDHCRTCGRPLQPDAGACPRCKTPVDKTPASTTSRTVRDAGGLNRLRAAQDAGPLLAAPLLDSDLTIPDDGFRFIDGRIVHMPAATSMGTAEPRETETLGSVNFDNTAEVVPPDQTPLDDDTTQGASVPQALTGLDKDDFAPPFYPPPPGYGPGGSTSFDESSALAPTLLPGSEALKDSAETFIERPTIRAGRGLVQPGDLVDGYVIKQEIGRGGMGRVYRAEHEVTGQEAALKMLLPQLVNDARLKARFVNEAKVLARLEHTNLVRLLGFIESQRRAFIVMPYVAGTTLDKCMQREGRLDMTAAFDLFSQMVDGLDHMHRHGVMHRDLKPSNVIIQADGKVKITDFGIARAVGSAKLTMEGMVVGTAEYLAPEQANGTLRDDLRSDVYSLAILLYEMLTGRVPFRHPSAAKVLIKQVSAAPPPPRTIRPEIPVGVEAALLRALAKKPDARFDSVVDFREAVAAGFADDRPTAHQPPAPADDATKLVRPPRKAMALIVQIMVGGVIGAGLAAAIWFYAAGR